MRRRDTVIGAYWTNTNRTIKQNEIDEYIIALIHIIRFYSFHIYKFIGWQMVAVYRATRHKIFCVDWARWVRREREQQFHQGVKCSKNESLNERWVSAMISDISNLFTLFILFAYRNSCITFFVFTCILCHIQNRNSHSAVEFCTHFDPKIVVEFLFYSPFLPRNSFTVIIFDLFQFFNRCTLFSQINHITYCSTGYFTFRNLSNDFTIQDYLFLSCVNIVKHCLKFEFDTKSECCVPLIPFLYGWIHFIDAKCNLTERICLSSHGVKYIEHILSVIFQISLGFVWRHSNKQTFIMTNLFYTQK